MSPQHHWVSRKRYLRIARNRCKDSCPHKGSGHEIPLGADGVEDPGGFTAVARDAMNCGGKKLTEEGSTRATGRGSRTQCS
jgi:hypothetical protein